MRKFDHVFFDLDGTLADSIPALYEIYLEFLREFGITGTWEEFTRLNGPTLPEIAAYLKNKYQLPGSSDQLFKTYSDKMRDSLYHRITPRQESTVVLERLNQRGYHLTLVTSAARDHAAQFLKKYGWQDYFSHLITAEDVTQSKPHPDIYHAAIRRSQADPARVLVIEDGDNGVQAARGAGLQVCKLAATGTILPPIMQALGEPFTEPFVILTGNVIEARIASHVDVPSDTATMQRVDDIWREEERRRAGQIFNGTTYAMHNVYRIPGGWRIDGDFVEYKLFLAQCRGLDLSIRTVGVSGVLSIGDGREEKILFARRAPTVTQFPNCFEMVPSGTVDQACLRPDGVVDVTAKLLEEMAEECGVGPAQVQSTNFLGIVYDPFSVTYDICIRIHAKVTAADLLRGVAERHEYFEPVLVPRSGLTAFLAAHDKEIVTTTKALIEFLATCK